MILDGRVPHAVLLELFTDHGAGTLIHRSVKRSALRASLLLDGFPARHELAQRAEPFGKAVLLKVRGPICRARRPRVERRRPFDQRTIVGHHRHDADRRHIVLHRKRRRAAEFVGVGALDVGMREQMPTRRITLPPPRLTRRTAPT